MTRTAGGARVLITGAAGGMGLLYVERAVTEGASDVVMWDRDPVKLDEAADRMRLFAEAVAVRKARARGEAPSRAAGAAVDGGASIPDGVGTAGVSRGIRPTRIHAFAVDVSDADRIRAAAAKVLAVVGTPDILINNAGIVRGKYFWEHDSTDDTIATMQVNALGPMLVTAEFLPSMIDSDREARIVNIASAAGLISNPRMSVYAASKWAVIGWSDSVRLELMQQGHGHVKVTTVAPSYISTGMFEGARGPVMTPILTPEYVVGRVWAAMLAGTPLLTLPRSVRLGRVLKGILPTRVWDTVADRVFGLYSTMDEFTGR